MDNGTLIEPLFEQMEGYGKVSLRLAKLRAIAKIISVLSGLVAGTIPIVFLLLFVAAANVGVALWLGDWLGKSYYGFFCVAIFYAFWWVMFQFLLQGWLKKIIGNSLLSILR